MVVAKHETTNGALTPPSAITTPPSADPAASPPIRAAEIQVNASVSLPGLTERPTSAYWQENTGAIVTPASRLQNTPAAIESPKTEAFTRGVDRNALADMSEIARAVMYLVEQGSRGLTHELQVTPAAERWLP